MEQETQSAYAFLTPMYADEHIPLTLMPGDVFNFNIRVFHYTTNTDNSVDQPCTLYYNPSQSIPCHTFMEQGRDFFMHVVSRVRHFVEDPEEMLNMIMSTVLERFQLLPPPPPPSSFSEPHRFIRLRLIVRLYDDVDRLAAAVMEESMQSDARMVPASKEAIRMLLKKSIGVVTRDKCCPVCLEEFDDDVECSAMPCNHLFHSKCIVTWLKTSHVCPMCRYALPTLSE